MKEECTVENPGGSESALISGGFNAGSGSGFTSWLLIYQTTRKNCRDSLDVSYMIAIVRYDTYTSTFVPT